MDSGDASSIILLLILLLLSAFFSSAETCLTTVNKIRIKTMADDGVKRATVVLKLIDMKPRMLSAILIGNNIVNLTSSSITTTFAIRFAKNSGLSDMVSLITGIATGILTLLILIFGEIVPKTIATNTAERMSLIYAIPVYWITNILRPVSFVMTGISDLLLKLFHIDTSSTPNITENEFLSIVDESHAEGVIESEERQMITNVVDFGDSLVRDVMIPKPDMCFVSDDITYEELLTCYRDEMHTRMPIYHENRDNVIGVIHLKDLFFFNGDKKNFDITKIMRQAYFTYEYKKTSELFFDMKQESISIAIVLDEYGATAGLLTTEDLIEEIVGDIRDEFDLFEEDEIRKKDENTYIVSGLAKLDDIDEQLGTEIESEEYNSISGHIINILDHFPETGEKAYDEFAEYTVLKAENNRVDKVLIRLLPRTVVAQD